MVKQVTHTTRDGRKTMVLVPDDAPESREETAKGVLVGPPDLGSLNLPTSIEVRLHNELYHRRLFTRKDVMTRSGELFSALQAALRVDVTAIINLYQSEG